MVPALTVAPGLSNCGVPNPLSFRLIFRLEKTGGKKIILVTMAVLCYQPICRIRLSALD